MGKELYDFTACLHLRVCTGVFIVKHSPPLFGKRCLHLVVGGL